MKARRFAFPPVLQSPAPGPLLNEGPGRSAPLNPSWGAERGRLMVCLRPRLPSEPPAGSASGPVGSTGTRPLARKPGAIARVAAPLEQAAPPDSSGPLAAGSEGRLGWRMNDRYPGMGMSSGARPETMSPVSRSGSTICSSCSAKGAVGRICCSWLPAIYAWGCGSSAMPGNSTGTKTASGVDIGTARGYGSFSELATSGAIGPGGMCSDLEACAP